MVRDLHIEDDRKIVCYISCSTYLSADFLSGYKLVHKVVFISSSKILTPE